MEFKKKNGRLKQVLEPFLVEIHDKDTRGCVIKETGSLSSGGKEYSSRHREGFESFFLRVLF
jgi:hypothetical protein